MRSARCQTGLTVVRPVTILVGVTLLVSGTAAGQSQERAAHSVTIIVPAHTHIADAGALIELETSTEATVVLSSNLTALRVTASESRYGRAAALRQRAGLFAAATATDATSGKPRGAPALFGPRRLEAPVAAPGRPVFVTVTR